LSFNLKGVKEIQAQKIQNHITGNVDKIVSFKIRDKKTGNPVYAEVSIMGINVDNQVFFGTDFIFDAVKSKSNSILVIAEGYFFYSNKFTLDQSENSIKVIEMERVAPGKKMELQNLKFHQGCSEFLEASMPSLKLLLDFLILNEEVKIELRGHVNAPGEECLGKIQKLSENRAKNTYLYLVENGVDKSRVTYKGLGNTEMIYLEPIDLTQETANRRVEVIIVD
jgi:outer membrane protein OmpA-like peptidoglycan-associated protein